MILFQSKHYLIIDKPSQWLTHKTKGGERFRDLSSILEETLGYKIYPVHRLDRGTSGCLLFAKKLCYIEKLQNSLVHGDSHKYYTTLCLGHLDVKKNWISRPLTSHNKSKQVAWTQIIGSQSIGLYSLALVKIINGRNHQIRRHLSFEKHHIIGDVQHGKGWLNRRFREKYNFHRMYLHCSTLSFIDPFNGRRVIVNSPMPKELIQVIDQLKLEFFNHR